MSDPRDYYPDESEGGFERWGLRQGADRWVDLDAPCDFFSDADAEQDALERFHDRISGQSHSAPGYSPEPHPWWDR